MSEPLTDTPENRLRLTRLLASPLFSGQGKWGIAKGALNEPGLLLQRLATNTMERGPEPEPSDVLPMPVKRLNALLKKYFDLGTGDGRFDPEEWLIEKSRRYISFERRESLDMLRGLTPFEWYQRKLHTHEIDPDVLKRFLSTLCKSERISIGTLDSSVESWATANDYAADFSGKQPALEALFACVKESPRRTMPFEHVVSLAWQLGIHRVTLDHLLSNPTDDLCVTLRYPGPLAYTVQATLLESPDPAVPFRAVGTSQEGGRGAKSQYWIAGKRLSSSDAAFVYLVLEPGGHSDHHHHPGEELQFVLKGTIRTVLTDSGMECQVSERSFLHFYSEQNHIVYNDGPDYAHVLVIRFYPLSSEDTRHSIRNRLWDRLVGVQAKDQESTQGSVPLQPEERNWLLEAATGRAQRFDTLKGVPSEVSDRLGLVRLLQRGELKRGEWTQFRRDAKIEAQEPDQWLSDIATYRTSVPRSLLPRIAHLYGTFNLLMFSFLFPSHAPTVFVRRAGQQRLPLPNDWVRLSEITAGIEMAKPAEGVKYEIPRRSLTYSGAGVTWLTLAAKGGTTKRNRHEGSELLVPMSGSVKIRFFEGENGPPHTERDVSSAKREIAHFRSDSWHAVANVGDVPADIFVIRFHEAAMGKAARSK